jgi:hypothetical protein
MAGMLELIGCEFESPDQMRGNLPRELREWFREEHDASIETPVRISRTGQIYSYNSKTVMTDNCVIGTEIVSKPLKVADFSPVIKLLVKYLNEQGECGSPRCGIHFHISMAYNLPILKNLVKLAKNLEQVFYYVGSFGEEFRGIKNDFTFCRPITKFGPSVIPYNNNYVQVFNTEDLLQATSSEDFWDRYGGLNEFDPPGKYHPVRYGWMTLFNLINNKHTVEFRVFNHTLVFPYLCAAAELCRKFCEYSFNPINLPENSIYTEHTKDHVLDTLHHFARISEMDGTTEKILNTIIEVSPEINVEGKYFESHLRNSSFRGFRSYTPRSIPRGVVHKPNFVDIHVLER